MNLSINYLNKIALFLIAFVIWTGCAYANEATKKASAEVYTIAVLPVENLNRAQAPLKIIQQSLTTKLSNNGAVILPNEELAKFMSQHRLRYTGGLDEITSQAFSLETPVNAVLITSLELYNEAIPPKIAMTCRLVATGEKPEILWIDSVGLSGDDTAGILGIGQISNPLQLLDNVITKLSDSLSHYLNEETVSTYDRSLGTRFAPRTFYRSPALSTEKRYKMAVVPFLNKSDRKNASEILSLQLIEWLSKIGNIDVIEPGIRRQEFLKYRIILEDGLSLANADILFEVLDVDLILTGIVLDYQDFTSATGTPKVDFSTLVLERKSRKVEWASRSYNQGDDYVYLFDFGRIATAHVLAEKMTKEVIERLR